jgi:hypothetical protein
MAGKPDLDSRIIAGDGTPGHLTKHAFPARFAFDQDQDRVIPERIIAAGAPVRARIDGQINRGATMPAFPPWLAVAIAIAAPSAASAEPAFDARAICRTAIAAITGRDLKLFQATDAPDGVVALTFARPFDNFVWAYHCRLEGNRVIWADEPGRWRQEARDDKIFFEIIGSGAQLRIVKSRADGSTIQELFDRYQILER